MGDGAPSHPARLQSARSVWRQRVDIPTAPANDIRCNLRGACGGKVVAIRIADALGVVAICAERVEAKYFSGCEGQERSSCNLRGACGGKGFDIWRWHDG